LRIRRENRLVKVGLILTLLWMPTAAESTLSESEVKVGYLYNFAKFVEWPSVASEPGGPLVVGIVGKDDIGKLLEQTLEGKMVNKRQLRIQRSENSAGLKKCHIVFFGKSASKNLKSQLKELEAQAILTVGETGDFTRQGGMIGLLLEDNRVKIEVNMAAVERGGLQISSRVLQLARLVEE
jgi:hypothetical protein